MSTSGTFAFSMTNAEIIDEAFERCGVDPSSLVARHLRSAVRSLNLLFSEWENRGKKLWAIEQETLTLTASDTDFVPPSGTQVILEMALRRVAGNHPVTPRRIFA